MSVFYACPFHPLLGRAKQSGFDFNVFLGFALLYCSFGCTWTTTAEMILKGLKIMSVSKMKAKTAHDSSEVGVCSVLSISSQTCYPEHCCLFTDWLITRWQQKRENCLVSLCCHLVILCLDSSPNLIVAALLAAPPNPAVSLAGILSLT
uniref:Uncharacterized protein n=1 Tax=Micrurus spixii TaxID=129469 RepID=A0A2D4M375_9SAUR